MTHHNAFAFSLQRLDIQHGARSFEQMVVLDARPQAIWQQEHLPDAYNFSWEDYTRADSDGVNYRIVANDELATALGTLGITTHSTILIYGDADSSWGSEGWLAWMLASLGHQGDVYLLDGGIQAWKKAKLPVASGATERPQPVTYQPQPQSHYTINAEQIAHHPEQITLVDTRNYWTEWLPGHLPNAVHLDWKSFYHTEEKRPLDGPALKALLEQQGIDLTRPVVYYCTGGIRSAYSWMVHHLAGLPAALNFEGGTEEWNVFQSKQHQ